MVTDLREYEETIVGSITAIPKKLLLTASTSQNDETVQYKGPIPPTKNVSSSKRGNSFIYICIVSLFLSVFLKKGIKKKNRSSLKYFLNVFRTFLSLF